MGDLSSHIVLERDYCAYTIFRLFLASKAHRTLLFSGTLTKLWHAVDALYL